MGYELKFVELNKLKLNKINTFIKIIEEIGECNSAINDLLDYEKEHTITDALLLKSNKNAQQYYNFLIKPVIGEIMDVAQSCASQLFILKNEESDIEKNVNEYLFDKKSMYCRFCVDTTNINYICCGCKDLYDLELTNLKHGMDKIIGSVGKIAQLNKFLGANGETQTINIRKSIDLYITELINIIKNSFYLLYSMNQKYKIKFETMQEIHTKKLIKKGYISF